MEWNDGWEQILNGERERTRGVWEGENRRLSLGFGLSLFPSGSRDIGRLSGLVICADSFKTVVRFCKVDVFEDVELAGAD